eukprot:5100502-Pyramimonas_sp.AAC.1
MISRSGGVLLKGKFTSKTDGNYKTISSPEVFRKLGIGTLFCDLRTRRLEWLQSLVKGPLEHAQVIGALIGGVRCESETVDAQGGRATAKANPWLQQLREDAKALECCNEGASFLESLEGGVFLSNI